MGVVVPTHVLEAISKSADPKKKIFELVGDMADIEVMFNQVLVAVYIRPEKTKGGIIRPSDNVAEDIWQGKVGLMLKHGPTAYQDDDSNQFHGQRVEVGEWCAMRISDSWQCEIRRVPCRVLQDTQVRLKIKDPSIVF